MSYTGLRFISLFPLIPYYSALSLWFRAFLVFRGNVYKMKNQIQNFLLNSVAIIFIIALALSISGCFLTGSDGGLNGLLSKTNNNQDQSTSQNRLDPNLAFGGNAYKNSSHDDNSQNREFDTSVGSTKLSIGGEHQDNSLNSVQNDTSNVVHNAMSELKIIIDEFSNILIIILMFIMVSISYHLGRQNSSKRENDLVSGFISGKYGSKN